MTHRCNQCGRSLVLTSALASHGAITDSLGQWDEPLRETIIPLGEWMRQHLYGRLSNCLPVLYWRSAA